MSMILMLVFSGGLLFGQRNTVQDQWYGTWKLNLSRTTFEAGPLTMSSTVTMQYDGTPVPVPGFGNGETMGVRRIDSYTLEVVQKSRDGFTITTRHVVSRDGKTLTSDQTLLLSDGKRLRNLSILDRLN